jgi:CheY-like chemotaxis protein
MKAEQIFRIILVEDNPADVFVLRHALDAQGEPYQLEVLKDGEEALCFVREYCGQDSEPIPCVLVLDLHLPKYDGLAVLKAIGQEPALSHMRVVALTGVTSPAEEAEIQSLGVRLYRTKPTDLNELNRLAEEIFAICKEQTLKAAM